MKHVWNKPYVTAGLVAVLGLCSVAAPCMALADESAIAVQESVTESGEKSLDEQASNEEFVVVCEVDATLASESEADGAAASESEVVSEQASVVDDATAEPTYEDVQVGTDADGGNDQSVTEELTSDSLADATDSSGEVDADEATDSDSSSSGGAAASDEVEGCGDAGDAVAVDEDADAAADEAEDEEVDAETSTTDEAEDAATDNTDITLLATLGMNMYRLYNPNSGEHFYTSSLDEAVSVIEAGWRYEGVGWVAPSSSSKPVYRLYNPNAGDHHYTTSEAERDMLITAGWKYEGVGWYSDTDETVTVLRQYNPNAVSGAHNFTTSSAENSNLVAAGWKYEGVGWYALSTVALEIDEGRWIVTSAWGSLERYWLGADAQIAKNRFVTTAEGAGYNAYATSTGAVVRGKWSDGKGHVYLADNNGKLTSSTGMLVTGSYDNGNLQRYYLEEIADGISAAKTGVFTVTNESGDSSIYYGLSDEGYVLRGKSDSGKGYVYLADNDGRLISCVGWLVTGVYDNGGLQRYWIIAVDGGAYAALTGFFTVSGDATLNGDFYGVSGQGYVLRGKMVYTYGSSKYMLLADSSSGVLEATTGWLTTSKYDDSSQIYYMVEIVSGYNGAQIGEFTLDDSGYMYYGRDDEGYIVRGSYVSPSGDSYYGDSSGKIDKAYPFLTDIGRDLWNRIQNLSSSTQYLIAVDCDRFRTVVFKGSSGNWTPIYDWLCGTGQLQYNLGQGTFRGLFTIGGDGADPYWDTELEGTSGYKTTWQSLSGAPYITCFNLSMGFHGTLSYDGAAESQLGKYVSHGCVRLLTENAKWIYYNCGFGTTVRTF